MVVVEEEGGGNDRVRWGTWEELILGGAVIRHGSHNWDAVASELQSRSFSPFLFTPQACKAKYDVLQVRYSGCSAWVEELRKKRLDELRRALEKSESSIGSLETKLGILKAEKAVCSYADYGCSAAELSEPLVKSGGIESAGKEGSRDGSSAGSFTVETQTNWLPQCQAAATEASAKEFERKSVFPEPCVRVAKFPSINKLAETMRLEHGVNIRRRRGKRRRKDLSMDRKDGSVGENNFVRLPNFLTMTNNHAQPMRSPDANDPEPCTSKQEADDVIKIFDSIMENEHASVFRRRLDSQKRARYKRIIRQHVDLDTIRSRIDKKCITSTMELLRDLLLLANNALVFYSKSTREYKCGLVLRDLVNQVLQKHYKAVGKHYKAIGIKVAAAETPKSPSRKPPAKPRTARPFKTKCQKDALNAQDSAIAVVAPKACSHPPSNVCSPPSAESLALTKKTHVKRGKVGHVKRGSAGIQAETPMKVRKRTKVK